MAKDDGDDRKRDYHVRPEGYLVDRTTGDIVAVVVDIHEASACEAQRSGPPRVATDAYREGYARIFGGRVEPGQA